MGTISQVRHRDELLMHFSLLPPVAECSFFLTVDTPSDLSFSLVDFNNDFIVTAFSFPQLGISYSQSSEHLGYSQPQMNMSTFEVSFLCKSDFGKPKSLVHTLYNRQFNKSGTLKPLLPSALPRIHVCVNVAGFDKSLVELIGCKFSYPTPTVNLASANQAVFRTVISYSDFIISE